MLSRTAEDLYWMARYMERAENAARVLDVSYRMSLLPTELGSASLHWRPAVEIGPDPGNFYDRYQEATAANVIEYMALDPDNPSSIYACIRAARENARTDRTAISNEMWESLNSTWLELRDLTPAGLRRWGQRAFFDWIKERSHLFRGVTVGTMLHSDPFHFIRLGTFLERADNTARILDVKYHVLLPEAEEVGGAVDYYQWGALLRSVSAFRPYRAIYRDLITPWRVAEMLILRPDLPRSLHYCFERVTNTLDRLAGYKTLECRRLAGEIHASLRFGKIEAIFQEGLHEFLTAFIRRNNRLGGEIQRDFMMAEVVE
ncbi:MAG: alpha-E domain-containing protein [Alphaproteobacteria bacterium]|nr:alpha-E domain-containing protein [Alphaproteobacteria bacterium]